jgi:hypothetical protein
MLDEGSLCLCVIMDVFRQHCNQYMYLVLVSNKCRRHFESMSPNLVYIFVMCRNPLLVEYTVFQHA